MSDGDDIPVCPICGTDVWINWDIRFGSGKCQYGHMVMTDTAGKLYSPKKSKG